LLEGYTKKSWALKLLKYRVTASGDSYNDLTMLKAADKGVLFKPPATIAKKNRKYAVTKSYKQLLKALDQ